MKKVNLIMYCEEVYSLFSGEFSKSRFGGAGLQMFFLAKEFAKDPDMKVTFIFCRHDVRELSHPTINLINYPRFIQHGVPGASRIINQKRKKQFLSSDDGPVVFLTTMAMNAMFACSFAQNFNAKTILRIASDADILAPIGLDERGKQDIFSSMSDIDQLVVQTEFQRNTFQIEHDFDSVVIDNGIPLSEPERGNVRSHILWVASAQELKQPHYFLDLVAAFPQEKFVMVMPYGAYPVMDGFEKRAKKLKNLDLRLEQLPLDEVNGLFSKAKAFVNTSAIEGFPNTFLQAASAGTPIISLSVNPDNVLEKNNIGIAAEGNIWRLPSILEKMLTDKGHWETFSINGPKYIKKHRDIVNSANKYKKIMQKIIEG